MLPLFLSRGWVTSFTVDLSHHLNCVIENCTFPGEWYIQICITISSLSTVLVTLVVSLNWLAHALEWHVSEREGEQWITWLTPFNLSLAPSAWMNKWGQCRNNPRCQKQGRKWWPSWRAVLQCFSWVNRKLIWHGLFSLPFSLFSDSPAVKVAWKPEAVWAPSVTNSTSIRLLEATMPLGIFDPQVLSIRTGEDLLDPS